MRKGVFRPYFTAIFRHVRDILSRDFCMYGGVYPLKIVLQNYTQHYIQAVFCRFSPPYEMYIFFAVKYRLSAV